MIGLGVGLSKFSHLYSGIFNAFSPLNVATLAAWYDAQDSSTMTFSSGNSLQEWMDKSGNTRNVIQNTSGSQPSYVPGTALNSGLVFNGSSTSLPVDLSWMAETNYTIFVVENVQAIKQQWVVCGSNLNNDSCFQIKYGSDNGNYLAYGQFGDDVNGPQGGTYTTNTLRIWTITLNSSGKSLYVNNSLLGSSATTTELSSNTGNTFGYSPYQSSYYNGILKEFIGYSSGLNNTQISEVYNYLLNKWTIPVVTGSDYITSGSGAQYFFADNSTLTWSA